MDKDAIDRLRYLCTVPTHSPADLEELQGLVEGLLMENSGLVKQLAGSEIMYTAARAGFETMKRRAEGMERDLRAHTLCFTCKHADQRSSRRCNECDASTDYQGYVWRGIINGNGGTKDGAN